MDVPLKPVEWIGSSFEDLKAFPDKVRQAMGYALYVAQCGEKHPLSKPLKDYVGAGILEVISNFDGDTYRLVYTVRFADTVYVLHAFQKKSKRGIATPKQDLKLIEARLKRATEHYSENDS